MSFDSGVGASLAFEWRVSAKTPNDYLFVICNRGWPGWNDIHGFAVIEDGGQVANNWNPTSQITSTSFANTWFSIQVGREDGSCTKPQVNAVPRKSKTDLCSVIVWSSGETNGHVKPGTFAATQVFTLAVPGSLVEPNMTPIPEPEPEPTPLPPITLPSELPPGTERVDCSDPRSMGSLPDGTCFADIEVTPPPPPPPPPPGEDPTPTPDDPTPPTNGDGDKNSSGLILGALAALALLRKK